MKSNNELSQKQLFGLNYVNYNGQFQTSKNISVKLVGFILCRTFSLNFDLSLQLS